MKTKNAEIKTKGDAIQRVIDGEKFLYKDCLFYYDEEAILLGQSPFRVSFEEKVSSMEGEFWIDFEQWERELHWYEQLEQPRLCWVTSNKAVLITGITRDPKDGFFDTIGDFYEDAVPVEPDELIGGQNEKA